MKCFTKKNLDPALFMFFKAWSGPVSVQTRFFEDPAGMARRLQVFILYYEKSFTQHTYLKVILCPYLL